MHIQIYLFTTSVRLYKLCSPLTIHYHGDSKIFGYFLIIFCGESSNNNLLSAFHGRQKLFLV